MSSGGNKCEIVIYRDTYCTKLTDNNEQQLGTWNNSLLGEAIVILSCLYFYFPSDLVTSRQVTKIYCLRTPNLRQTLSMQRKHLRIILHMVMFCIKFYSTFFAP